MIKVDVIILFNDKYMLLYSSYIVYVVFLFLVWLWIIL